MSERDTEHENCVDRRSVLRGVGAAGASLVATGAASGSALARGPDVPLRVNVWYTRDAERGDVRAASRNLASQLGVDLEFENKGTLNFDRSDFETFGELHQLFESKASLESGVHNLLVHYKKLPDEDIPFVGYDGCSSCSPNGGNLMDDYAGGGLSLGSYKQDNAHRSMVNSGLSVAGPVTSDAYRNLIKHELLHGMLKGSNSPHAAATDGNGGGWAEHSFGTIHEPAWWKFWDTDSASPMLTGYAEPVSSNVPNNNDFARVCGGGTVTSTYTHDPELSECTRQEARRWLREEFQTSQASDRPQSKEFQLATRELGDGESHVYEFDVEVGECSHAVVLEGPDEADLDLFVTMDGRTPTTSEYDESSWGYGSNERVEVDAESLSEGGQIGILVDARRGSGEYTLTVHREC